MFLIIALLFVGLVLFGMKFLDKRRDYSLSPSPFPSQPPRLTVCAKCNHAVNKSSAREVDEEWFCYEHTPKYDYSRENINGNPRFYREDVECDENGVILKSEINPK